jgi:hypothetical protein
MSPTKENTMTTKTAPPITTTAWAADRGRLAAERRAAQEAARQAEAATDEARRDVPIEILTQRFAHVAAAVLELVDAHATAGGIRVILDSVHPPRIALHVPADALNRDPDRLILEREDDTARVTVSSHARGHQLFVDLADASFEAASAARRIAERWFHQIELTQGGTHVDPR